MYPERVILSGRRVLLGLAIAIVACVIAAWLRPDHWHWLTAVAGGCAVLSLLVLNAFRPPGPVTSGEPDEIAELPPRRRAELIRGTSKFLREMRYRYSIRPDPNESGERKCFTAEVNQVRLGFVPALITDITDDRQGYGYVAFVYDHNRWRGPGLPCPAGQSEAVKHAARCVSPLGQAETAPGADGPNPSGEDDSD
jgi:hypothetical protein